MLLQKKALPDAEQAAAAVLSPTTSVPGLETQVSYVGKDFVYFATALTRYVTGQAVPTISCRPRIDLQTLCRLLPEKTCWTSMAACR